MRILQRLYGLFVPVLLLAACSAPSTVVPMPATITPTPRPTATQTSAPPPEYISSSGFQIEPIAIPDTIPVTAVDFADIPGNLAQGKPAPDFTAYMMGDYSDIKFTLSEQRGTPIILIPTIPGCGECLQTLQALTKVYANYPDRNVQVAIVSILTSNEPEIWQYIVDFFDGPSYLWGVVEDDFVTHYDITDLDTVLIIDEDGNLVFRNQDPLSARDFEILLELLL